MGGQHIEVSLGDPSGRLAAAAAYAAGPAGQSDPRAAADGLGGVLDQARYQLGKDDGVVLEATRVLAALRRRLGELTEARSLLENALAAGQFTRGENDAQILGLSYDLAMIAHELENRHEARRNFDRIRRFGPALLGPDHEYVRTAYRYFGAAVPQYGSGVQGAAGSYGPQVPY